MQRGVVTATLVLCVVAALPSGRVEAQPGSGQVVRTFFDSLIADDVDGAMALLSADVELQTPEGDAVVGADAVRAYLVALPRPIELGTMLPWGGHKYEAHITADGTPLVFLFDGAGGTIIFIRLGSVLCGLQVCCSPANLAQIRIWTAPSLANKHPTRDGTESFIQVTNDGSSDM